MREALFGLKIWQLTLVFMAVVLFAFYIGNLMFGDASLSTLMQIDEYEGYLISEIDRLKHDNADLQREYFDLLGLSAPEEME